MTILLVLPIALALRVTWGRHPSLLTAIPFWGVVLVWYILVFDFYWVELLQGAGLLMNAAVVLANRGRMPVVTHKEELSGVHTSVQRMRNPKLLFLCDRYHLGPLVVSPGDVLIFAPFVIFLFIILPMSIVNP